MSNPFDQFSADLRTAIPSVPPNGGMDGMSAYGAPAPQQPAMMNMAPPPMQGGGPPPPPPMGFGGGYGAPPMYGGGPPQGMPQGFMSQGPPMAMEPQGYAQGAPPSGQNPFGLAPAAPNSQLSMPQSGALAPGSGSYPGPASSSDPFGGYETSRAPPGPPPFQVGMPPAPGGFPPSQPPLGMPAGPPAYSNGSSWSLGDPMSPPGNSMALTVSSNSGNPFGVPAAPPAAAPPGPSDQNPFAAYGAPPAPIGSPMPTQGLAPVPPGSGQLPPFSADGGQSVYDDPWGAPAPYQSSSSAMVPTGLPVDPMAGALVPSQQQSAYGGGDPFAVFANAPATRAPEPQQPAFGSSASIVPSYGASYTQPPPALEPASDDLWGDMGFDAPASTPAPGGNDALFDKPVEVTEPGTRQEGELPPGGEWYDARIFTPTLGVMFFKPQELTDSLFLQTDREIVDALEDRPVVAFIVEGSSARSAGVELGHVLLKVNGIDVKNPKDASKLIKEGPRPLPLLFYVPDTSIVVAEGDHMVKYDTKETTAPNSAKDWKPKYVVIGGIIAQPWMMNMYRSKSEYDIAVIETQARRPVSVKVKQFSLQGARIQNDWQGPQMVKYKNKLHPWKYIVVLPVARNPIKISAPNLSQLKPVHEGIRRVLLAQQRGGSNANTAAPVRSNDPYVAGQNGHGGEDPYSRRPPNSDPYGSPQSSRGGGGGDPYGGRSVSGGSDPYGGRGGGDPYGSRGGGDPYGTGGGDPYGGGGDPYASRGGSGYSQQSQQQQQYSQRY